MSPSVIKWRTSWPLVNPLVNSSPISLRRKLKDDWETVRHKKQEIKSNERESGRKVSISEKMIEENVLSWQKKLLFGKNPYYNASFDSQPSICWIVYMLLSISGRPHV